MNIILYAFRFLLYTFSAITVLPFFFASTLNIYVPLASPLNVYSFNGCVLSVQYVLVDALTALGKIKVSLYLSASRKITFLVSIVLLAAFSSAAQNAFYAEPIADILSALQTAILFVIVYKSLMKQYMRTYKL